MATHGEDSPRTFVLRSFRRTPEVTAAVFTRRNSGEEDRDTERYKVKKETLQEGNAKTLVDTQARPIRGKVEASKKDRNPSESGPSSDMKGPLSN